MTLTIYIIPLLIGYFIVRLWQNKVKFFFLEKLALGFGLGTLVITFIIFILSFFGFRFSQSNILILSAGLLIVSLVISYFFQPFRISLQIRNLPIRIFQNKSKIISHIFLLILILIIIFKIGYVFAEAYLRPIIQFDAVANWSLRARVFFFQERIPIHPQEPYWLGAGGHENYPLHLPLLELWASKILGQWHEPTLEMISPFYYLSLLIIFYFTLSHLIGKKLAIIFTFFLATLPFLNYHAFAAYADLPLSFYLTAAVILCFLGLKKNNGAYFSLAILFCFGAAWIKNEGLFLSLIILFCLTIYLLIKKQLKSYLRLISLWLIFFILLLPWLIFMAYHHLGFSNIGARPSPASGPMVFGFYPRALSFIWASLLLESGWHILWLVLILTLISWPKSFFNKFNLFLGLNVFGSLFFYFALYLFTSANFEYLKMGMILNRNLLTVVPLVLFYLGLIFSENFNK
ncbi:MAG: hypothetical protein ACPL3E_02375 [Minisyncoccia bacterium]